MSELRIVLKDCQRVLLEEIADSAITQKSLASTYRLALRSGEEINWGIVNRAIIKRWSLSGLKRVKKMAWGM